VELQGRLADLDKAGLGLVSITYDPAPVIAEFSTRRGITFPLLSDAGSATIRKYGILNTTVPESNPAFGYPFPGTFVVDRQGVVIARFFEDTYQERGTLAAVLVRLGRKVTAQPTRTTAPHLAIASYLTDQVAAPGTKFSIVLDISPGRRIHIYARGVAEYQPIALTIQPQPGLVIKALDYPKAENYFFRPLNESVPVYRKPFRLVQDVTVDPSREAAATLRGMKTMTLTAQLVYQACDDKLCFPPASVPLSWPIAVRSLDTERVK